jgi:hypothetical protein
VIVAGTQTSSSYRGKGLTTTTTIIIIIIISHHYIIAIFSIQVFSVKVLTIRICSENNFFADTDFMAYILAA